MVNSINKELSLIEIFIALLWLHSKMWYLHKLSPLDWHQMLHVNYRDNYRNRDNFTFNNRNMHKMPYRTSLNLKLSVDLLISAAVAHKSDIPSATTILFRLFPMTATSWPCITLVYKIWSLASMFLHGFIGCIVRNYNNDAQSIVVHWYTKL